MDGRAEGLPGWTVDRYGPVGLIQSYGAADPDTIDALASVVCDAPPVAGVVLKERGVRDRGEGRLIRGSIPPPPADDPFADRPGRGVITEDGARLGIDLLYGVNTGLFLDARPLRQWVRQHANGARVLNLFSYTAAFGVAAALGGARSTTNVDLVPSALERGRANYQLNSLPIDPRGHLRSDVFELLKKALERGTTWDLVIVDPPPVPTVGRGRRGRGFDPRRDTQRLLESALGVCAPGGIVLALSAAAGTGGFEEPLARATASKSVRQTPLDRGADFPGDEGLRAVALHP